MSIEPRTNASKNFLQDSPIFLFAWLLTLSYLLFMSNAMTQTTNASEINMARRDALYQAAGVTTSQGFGALAAHDRIKAARQAARLLNARGLRRPNGARWDLSSVQVTL